MKVLTPLITVALMFLTGCASYPPGRDRGDTIAAVESRRPIVPLAGVVRDSMPARIVRDAERTDRLAGAGLGAGAGALIAQTGKRSAAKTGLLATLGAVLGDTAVRRSDEPADGEQVIVEITEGKMLGKKMAIVQQMVDRPLKAGEPVWITIGPKTTRVVRRGGYDGQTGGQTDGV